MRRSRKRSLPGGRGEEEGEGEGEGEGVFQCNAVHSARAYTYHECVEQSGEPEGGGEEGQGGRPQPLQQQHQMQCGHHCSDVLWREAGPRAGGEGG